MNWKKYKALDDATKHDENYYIIGLDIGNDSSGLAFYNIADQTPETIDLSGGYGKPSIPTAMQYIPENKEWIFGEYAVLNRGGGTEITLQALMSRLGRFDYIDVDHRSVSVASVLGLFIKDILSKVNDINPKAEIVGIVATVPAYFSEQAREEYTRAFKSAGYEKELIAFASDRECVLARHYQRPLAGTDDTECTLLLDFGSRELRGGLYDVRARDQSNITATSMSSVFDNEVSTTRLNGEVSDMFEGFVLSHVKPPNASQTRIMRELTAAFTYQNKDALFQKAINQRPLKLYFNFAYPPFQESVDKSQMAGIIKPYSVQFNSFIQSVLEKSLYDSTVSVENIDTVLCVGGGFEMLWAKDAIDEIFTKEQVRWFRNPKMITAEGAALVAARFLDAADGTALTIKDEHQLTGDIGLLAGEDFLPLVERNAFWWQNHLAKLVLVNEVIDGELEIDLAERPTSGDLRIIGRIKLEGLPKRPKGVTRLQISAKFESNKELILSIEDMGFGELFPKAEYERFIEVKI